MYDLLIKYNCDENIAIVQSLRYAYVDAYTFNINT